MKASSLLLPLFAAALLSAFVSSTHAAPMTWGSPTNISSNDTDVSTTGTLFGALNLGGPDTTVNGVLFQGFTPSGNSGTSGNFTFLGSFFGVLSGVGPASPPFSSSYQTLLNSAIDDNESITLTISGLTLGDQYQFQWWTNDSTTNTNNDFTTATDVNSVALQDSSDPRDGGIGQFALGSFTATGTTEIVRFTRGSGDSVPIINAFQLRDITPTAPVPESGSTLLLLLLALGALLVVRRRSLARALEFS